MSSLERETKTYNLHWIAITVIGSLVLCTLVIGLNWYYLQQTKSIYRSFSQAQHAEVQTIAARLDEIDRQYQSAKVSLLAQIGANSVQMERDLLADVKNSLDTIEQATHSLRSAIIAQPENPNLYHLLNSVYQQELMVLSRLSKLNSLS